MSDVKAVTDATFQDEVINSDVPVMVDFWAPWCGPCNILTPVVDEIAREMAGKVKVVKVNVDESQGVASQYSIMSIPTLMFFKGGQRVGQIVGAQPKKVIVDNLTKLV